MSGGRFFSISLCRTSGVEIPNNSKEPDTLGQQRDSTLAHDIDLSVWRLVNFFFVTAGSKDEEPAAIMNNDLYFSLKLHDPVGGRERNNRYVCMYMGISCFCVDHLVSIYVDIEAEGMSATRSFEEDHKKELITVACCNARHFPQTDHLTSYLLMIYDARCDSFIQKYINIYTCTKGDVPTGYNVRVLYVLAIRLFSSFFYEMLTFFRIFLVHPRSRT